MNRNQKIAIGCGGGGCLGLIVLLVVGIVGYMYYTKSSRTYANRNDNTNFSFNTNSNTTSDTNSNTATDDSASSSTMSEDDKHKLFQAAGITNDGQLILKVLAKIGYPAGTGSGYEQFAREHYAWAMQNLDFMQTVNTPEKGRAYVEAHLDD
jgi:hypothetical protein